MTTQTLEKSLRPGWYLSHKGNIYQITAFHTDSLELDVVNQATTETTTFSLMILLADDPETLYFAPSLTVLQQDMQKAASPVGLFETNTLPESLLTRARYILATVSTVEQRVDAEKRQAKLRGESFRRTPVLKQVLADSELSVALSTFYKYRRLCQEHKGSEASLATALRRSDMNQTRMNPAQLHFLDTLILRYYKRRPPLRPQTLYRLAQSVLKRTTGLWLDPNCSTTEVPQVVVEELLDPKLPIAAVLNNPEKAALLIPIQLPSRSWFYTYLRWFEQQPGEGKALVTARYGAEKWEQEYMVFDTFVTHAALPLEYVFADHYLLDAFVVDETTRRERNRLWLTVLIDAYSRSILGMALLYENPNIMSIQSALHHAIWPKASHTALGVTGKWLCYGIPQQLSLDNAWAHHSHSLEDLARVISQNGKYASIDLVFRPPYRGRYGALVERFFGNLSGQIRSLLPGSLQSSQPQHVRQAAREACLLYQDVNRFLHQMVLNYQHTVHSELQGLTPHEKWLEGVQMGLPLVPPQTSGMQRTFWRLHPQTRVLSSKGVNVFGMSYRSPELSQAARYDHHGQLIRYAFRYDPADISRLALFRDGNWVGDVYAQALRQPDGSWLTVSLAERKLAQRMAREAGASPRDWLHYLHDLDELVQTRQKEQRRAHSVIPKYSCLPVDSKAVERVVDELSVEQVYEDYTDLLLGFLDDTKQSERKV